MARRRANPFARAYQRNLRTLTRATAKAAARVAGEASRQVAKAAAEQLKPPPGKGDWLVGAAIGPAGARRYHLYRPSGLIAPIGERPPLIVMLHGCWQTSRDFAIATRMNRLAERERFLVLYPEQDRLAHPNGCWRWYDVDSGKAFAEAATLMLAIDQVCLLHGADPQRVAVAGLSAGAGMAALLASRFPARFRAVVMHSGVAPGATTSSKTALSAMRGERTPPPPAPSAALHLPPLLVLHGDGDRIVSPRNAAQAAAVWAVAMGARPTAPRTARRGDRHPLRITDFQRGGRTMVSLCFVEGLGHAWSGGAPKAPFSDPAGPDATRMIWSFCAKRFAEEA